MEKINKPYKQISIDIETMGLDYMNHEITCVCSKADQDDGIDKSFFKNSLRHLDEPTLIAKFIKWLKTFSPSEYFILTKNGKMFDLPFIITRMVANNMEFTPEDREWLWSYQHVDLGDLARMKLDDLAQHLGVSRKNGKGIDAPKLAREGKWDELENYCMQDVDVTIECYERMREILMIEEDE